jgi:hypothetical protein
MNWVIIDIHETILARFDTSWEAYEATYTGEFDDDVEVVYLNE